MTDTTPQQSRPERVGKKGVMTYLPDDMAKQIKVFAAQNDRTIQDIGEEAFANWLKNCEVTQDGKKGGPVFLTAPDRSEKKASTKRNEVVSVMRRRPAKKDLT
jgi:hypothetical protein